MAIISGLMANCTGLKYLKFRFPGIRYHGTTSKDHSCVPFVSKLMSPLRRHGYNFRERSSAVYAYPAGRNHKELRFDGEYPEEPVWIASPKEAFWALKSLFGFLAEQPGQLKYIEWPSFQNTLKTATLTLVLVALLIVALSTVDAALCFLLALFLRRTV